MLQPSAELLAISRRFYTTILEQRDTPLINFLSTSEHLRFIGTAEGEHWAGQVVRDSVDTYFREIPRILEHRETSAEAFECGDIGWSHFEHRILFETVPDAPYIARTSLIFHLESGSWKIIQRHGSVPVPNEVSLGISQSRFTELAEAARESLNAAPPAEGLASVMFTDVVSSSTLAQALGDHAWSLRINDHFSQVGQIVESNGGRFVKSLGDGTMSSFTSARAALKAARDIQRTLATETAEPRLNVRIGLHTGDVVTARNDHFGNVVNKAARIADAAGRGEIFASDVTFAMIGDDAEFRFAQRGNFDLAGQVGPQAIHELLWRDSA